MNLISKIILKIISIIIKPFIKDGSKRMSYLSYMQELGFNALPQRYWEPVPLVSDIDSSTKMPNLIMDNIPKSEFEDEIKEKFLNKRYLNEILDIFLMSESLYKIYLKIYFNILISRGGFYENSIKALSKQNPSTI